MPVVRWPRDAARRGGDRLLWGELDRGDVLLLEGVTSEDDRDLAWCRHAPFVVVATCEDGRSPSTLADIVLSGQDTGRSLDEVVTALELNPGAATTLVHVLRAAEHLDVERALLVESLAYSMLLAGPEFAAWLSSRPVQTPRSFADPPIMLERTDDALRITLARPENRNAFSREMRDALFEALLLAEVDSTITSVEVSALGPVFCSGGDLTEFGTAPDVVQAHQVRTQRSVGAVLARLATRVTIRMHGPCIGAGVEVSCFASRVVASPGTTFRLPEIGMGLIPGAGGTVSVSRRIGRQRTALLALTSRVMELDEALSLGLVDEALVS